MRGGAEAQPEDPQGGLRARRNDANDGAILLTMTIVLTIVKQVVIS
jgi:hypothetical protein